MAGRTVTDNQREGPDCTTSLGAPSAKRQKTFPRCSKCGFITDDNSKFQQHILQHKTDENTPQCLHCGLCFTSVLSLNRHLFIVHRVKDPEVDEKEEVGAGTAKVVKKKQESECDGYRGTDEVKDSLPELNEPEPSQGGEPSDLHCDKNTNSNLKLDTQTQKEAVSLNTSSKLL